MPDTGLLKRVDEIEDLQRSEQVHVDELERVLEARIDALVGSTDLLNGEYGRLAEGLDKSEGRVQRQEERLKDHHSHLGALEERRRLLQEKVEGLGVVHARQDNETRALQQRLRRRSWLAGFLVINVGALLKVIWSFYFAGGSAWSIIPPVAIGAVVVNGLMLYVYRRVRRRSSILDLQ